MASSSLASLCLRRAHRSYATISRPDAKAQAASAPLKIKDRRTQTTEEFGRTAKPARHLTLAEKRRLVRPPVEDRNCTRSAARRARRAPRGRVRRRADRRAAHLSSEPPLHARAEPHPAGHGVQPVRGDVPHPAEPHQDGRALVPARRVLASRARTSARTTTSCR
ncbi:hypothetical protein DFH11DRAFT_1205775 [Phellopilus nigrolimitatus]|nr:hypothetical protein DFH11DRAFT_1205775 [Phellopilus nigrolimitatus]